MGTKKYDVFTELLHTGIGITENGKELTGDDIICLLNKQQEKIKELKCGITKKENVCEICADISLKRMYLLLLKTQEMILDINSQYNKKEIMNYLSSIEHDILMLNDKNNHVNRDLFD